MQSVAGAIDGLVEYESGCAPGIEPGRGVRRSTPVPDRSPGRQREVDDIIEALKRNDPGAIDPEATSELLTNLEC